MRVEMTDTLKYSLHDMRKSISILRDEENFDVLLQKSSKDFADSMNKLHSYSFCMTQNYFSVLNFSRCTASAEQTSKIRVNRHFQESLCQYRWNDNIK